MHKNKKKIFTAVITALFVLSVSYFALLSPTTAWFYQQDNTTYNYSFSFKNFKETTSQIETSAASIPLRAATRFADAGEWLFDEVAYVLPLTTTNESTGSDLTGIVHVNVTGLSAGIRWFAFAADTLLTLPEPMTGSGSGDTRTWTQSVYKDKIEAKLTQLGVLPVDYKEVGESAYTTFNTTYATPALNESHTQGFIVDPGQTKYIYVVFWAEYGDLKSDIQGGTNWTSDTYSAEITVEARPYTGKYSTNLYTLKLNGVSDLSKVTLYSGCNPNGSTLSAMTQDLSGISDVSNITVTGSSVVISVREGAQWIVQADGALSRVNGSVGTITGTGSTSCAAADMTENLELTVAHS